MTILRPADKPWVIAMLGEAAQTRIIQRYVNRQDALYALRFINKAAGSVGKFVVTFDMVQIADQLEQD